MPFVRITATNRAAATGRTLGSSADASARAAAVVPGAIALVGDSLTANGGRGTEINSLAYLGYANTVLGSGAFTLMQSVAVSGATSSDMLLQVAPALAGGPGWVSVLGPINDLTTAVPTATSIANLTTIWDQVLAAGSRLIVWTVLPCTSLNTALLHTAVDTINAAVRAYAASHAPVILCDCWSAFGDPNTDSGYSPMAGYTSDGKHPNATGAGVMGAVLATAVASVKPGTTNV